MKSKIRIVRIITRLILGGPTTHIALLKSGLPKNRYEQILIFQVAESREALQSEVAAFREILWRWLGGGAIVLLVMQAGVLIWSLAPVQRVAEEVSEIETGSRGALGSELRGERRRLTRALEATRARGAPRDRVPGDVGDGDDGVVERRADMRNAGLDVLLDLAFAGLFLRIGH